MEFSSTAGGQDLVFDRVDQGFKIGLISLSTDLTVENDFYFMRPNEQIRIFVNRVEFVNPTTRDNLLAMQPKIEQAARLILPDIELDAMVYACTSASAVIGDTVVTDSVARGKPGIPVVTPTTGAIQAFKQLGIDKITLLAPYIKQVSKELADYFCSQGLNIHNLHYLGIEDDREIGRLSHQSIIGAVNQAIKPSTEGIFLSCTAMPVVPIIKQLEVQTGVPIITSNQAMFWQALRRAGYTNPVLNFGQLLEH